MQPSNESNEIGIDCLFPVVVYKRMESLKRVFGIETGYFLSGVSARERVQSIIKCSSRMVLP